MQLKRVDMKDFSLEERTPEYPPTENRSGYYLVHYISGTRQKSEIYLGDFAEGLTLAQVVQELRGQK